MGHPRGGSGACPSLNYLPGEDQNEAAGRPRRGIIFRFQPGKICNCYLFPARAKPGFM